MAGGMGCPPAQLQGIAEEHRLRLFKGRVNAGAGIGGCALKRRRRESSDGDGAASRSFPSDCNGIVRQRQRHERGQQRHWRRRGFRAAAGGIWNRFCVLVALVLFWGSLNFERTARVDM